MPSKIIDGKNAFQTWIRNNTEAKRKRREEIANGKRAAPVYKRKRKPRKRTKIRGIEIFYQQFKNESEFSL